ncbi:MAG: COG1470 family protein [Planctomycetota bacterium]|jgi:hypothetical protein
MRKSAMAGLTALLIAGAARAQGPDALTSQVDAAVEFGLLNLAAQQQADGSWRMGGNYTAITAMCIDAFELHGHLPENNPLDDPYVDVVNDGFNFLLNQLQAVAIPVAADTNGNGIGIRAVEFSNRETYATAMCLMAFADSQAFGTVATVGPFAGSSYIEIAQDMVDYLAFGQDEIAGPPGGWGYIANQGGYRDNDNSRWVAMALDAAEWDYGLVIPAIVKPGLDSWVNYIQLGTGVSGYNAPNFTWNNVRKTAGLVSEFVFLGDGLGTARMQNALGWIAANWGNAGVANANTSGNNFAVQAMRRCASATWLGPTVLGLDWYDDPGVGSAPALVARQNPDGSWPIFDSAAFDSPPLTTALAIAALQVMRMSVDKTSVAFTAIEDDPSDPASEDVMMEETSRKLGPYYLNWTAADISSAAWLTISPNSGGDGSAMTLTAKLGVVPPDDYSATVEVGDPKAANGPFLVDVTFSIQSRAEIELLPDSVTFTAFVGESNPANQTVTVGDANTDANAIALAWTAAENPAVGWLSLPQSSGARDDVVEMSVDTTVLASGQYNAQVDVTDPNALAPKTRTINVTLDLYDRPVLDASPDPVQFTMLVNEAPPQSQGVTVSDASGATYPAPLSWTATESPDVLWLVLANASGTNDETVTLEANVAGLAAGDYGATVDITDPSALADLDVVVNLTVQSRPIISPAVGTVYFVTTEGEGNPSPQSVQIDDANAGVNQHPLSWTASEDVYADWLTITTGSGIAGQSVQMSAQILSYGPGDYPAQVNVDDPDAAPPQASFDAVLRVQSKPVINLPDGNITIYGFEGGTDPSPVQATVEDSASSAPNHIAMAWSAVENPDRTWLDITTNSGNDGDSMTLEAYVSGLTAGTSYVTSIIVSDPEADSTADFTVTFEVQTPPMMATIPTAITFNGKTFGGDPPLQTITVNDVNAGANPHPLSWTAAESPNVSWLVLANASGAAGDAVTLSASLAGLTPGDYNTTIVITDNDASNSPRNVGVTFHVDQGTPIEEADSFIGGAGCGGALLAPGGQPAAALFVPWVLLLAFALGRALRPRRPVGRAVIERPVHRDSR